MERSSTNALFFVLVGSLAAAPLGCRRGPGTNAATSRDTSPRQGPVPDADAPQFVALEEVAPYRPYLRRRDALETAQRGVGPIEGSSLPPTPSGAELVTYRSEGRELPGWLLLPAGPATPTRPGVVYLHNDFSLTTLSYRNARPLADAGFVVFLPTLRAENGNPGDFELLLGEVDDAKAAVAWLAAHESVDADAVYAVGHSIGGGIAALLSLHPDLRARRTASVGGIYRARTFSSWARGRSTRRLIRFDPMNKAEVTARLLGPNVRDMVRPHTAYAGRTDPWNRRYAQDVERVAQTHGVPYEMVLVDGGHMDAVTPAVRHFITTIRADAASAPGGPMPRE